MWVLVSVRINTRHDVEVVTVEKRTQRLVEYVVDDQLYTTQHSLSTQRIQVATVMISTARITSAVQIVLSYSPGVHPVQKRDWLTPRIPRTVYRYFWAYPFLFFFSFSHFLVVSSVRQIKLTYVSFWAHVKIASHQARTWLSRALSSSFSSVLARCAKCMRQPRYCL